MLDTSLLKRQLEGRKAIALSAVSPRNRMFFFIVSTYIVYENLRRRDR